MSSFHEFCDFDDKPRIYIRTNVQSCSNFEQHSPQNKNQRQSMRTDLDAYWDRKTLISNYNDESFYNIDFATTPELHRSAGIRGFPGKTIDEFCCQNSIIDQDFSSSISNRKPIKTHSIRIDLTPPDSPTQSEFCSQKNMDNKPADLDDFQFGLSSSSDNIAEEWSPEEDAFSSKKKHPNHRRFDILNDKTHTHFGENTGHLAVGVRGFSGKTTDEFFRQNNNAFFSSYYIRNQLKNHDIFGFYTKKVNSSFTRLVNNLFENPDGRMTNFQRITIILYTCFEAYRTIISSFLTVFVPQNCGGYSCSIMQNIIPKDQLEIAAISMNTFMAVYFCALFSTERIRETIIKRLLISDKMFSTDKDFLIKMLSEMEPRHQHQILRINRIYRAFAQFLLLMFFVNAGISCVVIQKNYLNNTTVTVFITNTFFMINRIYKALKITSSGEYNIYSAYRSDSLLYNRYRGKITETNIP